VQIKQLHIRYFKNYGEQSVDFHPKLNVIVGLNGTGKTNLLDAIYYLCCCKSYFGKGDKHLINHKSEFFNLQALFERNKQPENLSCKYGIKHKKEFARNRNVYGKIAEHIGLFPVSIIAPDDIMIVKGFSDDRRKLFNQTFAQLSNEYLISLMLYNKVLQQRNAYLKRLKPPYNQKNSLIDTYDAQLVQYGSLVIDYRKEKLERIRQLLQDSYNQIADNKEEVNVFYKPSSFANEFADNLHASRGKDLMTQRTNVGLHKDDWEFEINGKPIKKLGSQGQQKSFLIALKFALYHLIEDEKMMQPILLLDDIFDKLDSQRIQQMLELITSPEFGQVFLTDADNNRLPKILDALTLSYNLHFVENGRIVESEHK